MGAAVFGALMGPALGAVATVAGVRATFLGVGGLGFLLCAWVTMIPGEPAQPQRLSALRRLDAPLVGALWLVVLPALLFGVLDVLVPLKLHRHGWGGAAIAALFFATAAVEAVLNPLLGRFTDWRGRILPIRLALAGSIAVSVALAWTQASAYLAALVFAAGIAYGAFYTPGIALVSESAEHRGIALGLMFGVMNGAWAAGNAIGPAAGGALGEAAGDRLPYLILAGICVATLGAARDYDQPRSRPMSA
jgi:MFS family permease